MTSLSQWLRTNPHEQKSCVSHSALIHGDTFTTHVKYGAASAAWSRRRIVPDAAHFVRIDVEMRDVDSDEANNNKDDTFALKHFCGSKCEESVNHCSALITQTLGM